MADATETELVGVTFLRSTVIEIDKRLKAFQTRQDFIRDAVEKALEAKA